MNQTGNTSSADNYNQHTPREMYRRADASFDNPFVLSQPRPNRRPSSVPRQLDVDQYTARQTQES